jgi:hypothetical protein
MGSHNKRKATRLCHGGSIIEDVKVDCTIVLKKHVGDTTIGKVQSNPVFHYDIALL